MRTRISAAIVSFVCIAVTARSQSPGCNSAAFLPPESHPAISSGSAIATGDYNGDGYLDLAVANNAQLQLLAGHGTGAFAPPLVIAGAPAIIAEMATGDFNEDGLSDLATISHFGTSVSLFVGDATAGLVVSGQLVQSSIITSLTVGEVTGDSHLDIIATNQFPRYVVVHHGTGDAWTGSSLASQFWSYNQEPRDAAIGHFNGDTYPDMLVVEQSAATVRLYKGRASGVLHPTYLSIAIGSLPGLFLTTAVVAGDFDQDGHDDAAVLRGTSLAGRVSIALSQGDGTFAAPVDVTVGAAPTALAVADLNRDGNPDMIVSYASGAPTVLLGNGTGGFAGSPAHALANARRSVAIGDLDDNESLDLAFPSSSGANVEVLRNTCASPQFLAPTPCEQVLNASVGVPMAFTVAASILTGSGLTLDVIAPPASAVHSLPLPALGSAGSVATTFSWTPTNNDVGTHVVQYSATADGFTRTCEVTIQVGECYLLLGASTAHVSFGGGDVLLTTVDWFVSVTTTQIPTFPIPNVPAMAGASFYAQVVMFNPTVFPTDPLQLTNGLQVTLGSGVVPYGSGGSAMQLTTTAAPVLGGTISFAFTVPGM